MGGIGREVRALAGIGREVVELIGVGRRMDELERAAADHHHRRDRAFGQVFAERLVVAGPAFEVGREAPPVDRAAEGGVAAGQIRRASA